MNKHFEDTLYYLKRAGATAKRGVGEEVEPVEAKIRELTGRAEEPEPGRLEAVKTDLKATQERAEDEAKKAIGSAREAFAGYRGQAVESE